MSLLPGALHLPECPFFRLLHLQCPGCGATRATLALAHGNLRAAWQDNFLFVIALPFVLLYLVVGVSRSVHAHPQPWPAPSVPVVRSLLAVAALFTLLRNL